MRDSTGPNSDVALLATLAYAPNGGAFVGCAPAPLIKDASHNICVLCPRRTTPEGLMCGLHWAYLSGKKKAAYQRARIDAIKEVRSKENL